MEVTKEKDLLEQVKAYVEEDRIRQAILISGEWGVGKTHFIQSKLIPKLDEIENPDQSRADYKVQKEISRAIYVSLYGLTSQLEITEKVNEAFIANIIALPENSCSKASKFFIRIFRKEEAHLTNKKKKHINLGGLALQFAKTAFNNHIISGKIGKNIEIDFSTLYDCLLQQKIVIIFDDLERVAMPMQETLGFINNLVENNDAKVIIVANESRIENLCNDDSKESPIYREIKEKTIAFTYLYLSELSEVYQDIVNEKCCHEQGKSFLLEEDVKKLSLKIFAEEKCVNIRTFIIFVISFDKLYSEVHKIFENLNTDMVLEKIFYRNLVFQTASACIENKTPSITTNEEKSAQDSKLNWDVIKMCLATDCDTEGISLEHYDFVYRYVRENLVDPSHLVKALETAVEEMRTKSVVGLSDLSLKQLVDWHHVEERDLKQLLDSLKQELKDGAYATLYYGKIVHCLVFLEHFAKINYDFADFKDLVLSSFEKKAQKDTDLPYAIEKLKTSNLYGKQTYLELIHYEYIKPLLEVKRYTMCSYLEGCSEIDIDAFLSSKEMGTFLLSRFTVALKDVKEIPVKELSFLKNVDINRLTTEMKAQSLKELDLLERAFQQIYYSSSLRMVFKADRENLDKLVESLEKMILDESGNKTRQLAYEKLLRTLKDAAYYIAPLRVFSVGNASVPITVTIAPNPQ